MSKKRFKNIWIINLITVLILVSLCASCQRNQTPDTSSEKEEMTAPKKIRLPVKLSRRAAELLSNFDNILDEQENERKQQERQKEQAEEERLLQTTINQTVMELFSLNPQKEARHIKELIGDLKGIGPKALDALKDMLAENRPVKQKVLLIQAIGAFNTKESTEELYKQALEAPDREVQEASRQALKESANKETLARRTVEHIQKIEQTPPAERSPQEQLRVIAVLGVVGGDTALGELSNLLRMSDDETVKKHTVIAIGEIGGDYARQLLNDTLKNDASMRIDAAKALGKMKKEDIVTQFGEILVDANQPADMKAAAAEGLGADNGTLARTILLNTLKDASQVRETHERAVNTLIRGAGETTQSEYPFYVSIFESTPVEYLPQMMQPLLSLGGDYIAEQIFARYNYLTPVKKIHALRTLGRIFTKKSYKVLFSILEKETDPNLRREVVSATQKFTGKEFASSNTKLLKQISNTADDRQERITALKYLGDIAPQDAAKIAESWLSSGADQDTIITSIDVLKKCGDTKSKNALLAFKTRHGAHEFDERIEEAIKIIEIREKN